MQLKIARGRLARMNETSQPVLAHGIVAIWAQPIKEAEVVVEVASSPEGPWALPGTFGETRALSPRTWGLRLQEPTYVRLRCTDMRSWARPVEYEIATLSEAPENLSIDDRRPPPAKAYKTVDPALAHITTTEEE
jgi:hypothetical protein